MRFRVLALFSLLVFPCRGEGMEMDLISAPSLSANGEQVVFEWCQDLWIAPSGGGEAKRFDDHPGRDAYPRFTPDGKRVVFSSDRSGSMEVYSRAITGGETLRHTHHSEGNELECLSPDGRRAVVRGLRERSGFRATRLMEVDLTEDRRERRIMDATAHSPAWSPDGSTLLFCRGGEQLYRKGYKGARASRIWRFHPTDRSFHSETPGDFEARSPMWLPDGTGFYFVSNESGTANLWLKRDGRAAERLTDFQGDGMITPDLSADGSTMVFRRGSGVYRMNPGRRSEPERIHFRTREVLPDRSKITRIHRGCDDADFTRDHTQVVFSAGGDLWWIGGVGEKARNLTESPEAEDQPRFSPDGQWVYCLHDDGLRSDLRRARWQDGRAMGWTAITKDGSPKHSFKLSPDGSRIAWISGTGDVSTANADGSSVRTVFPCRDKPTIDWSPDGIWLAIAAEDHHANRDLVLCRADGSGKPLNLTRHPGFEGSPKWSPDGRWLVFTARREPSAQATLWRMDFGKGGIGASRSEASLIRVGEAAKQIPTGGIEPSRVMWAPDSRRILLQSRDSKDEELISLTIDGEERRIVARQRGVPIRVAPDGTILWRVKRRPEALAGDRSTSFPIEVEHTRTREEVLRLGFRRIWRTLETRFHDPRMNGADWRSCLETYEKEAVAALDSRQFDLVVSRLLGELNASHLSFLRNSWPGEEAPRKPKQSTAFPGIRFDDRSTDAKSPLVIAEVLPGSPLAESAHAPKAGDIVVRIAGQEVKHLTPLHGILDGAENRPLPIVIRESSGNERVLELRCVSYSKARRLDEAASADRAARRVHGQSADTAYLRVEDMSRRSLEKLAIEIHRANESSKRLILDLRHNGGGREADRMLNLFTQVRHSYTTTRGGPRGYPSDRLSAPSWWRPMVVICNEHTFSNSEIFCHALKTCGRAPLVGTATAGGVISAVGVGIPDVGTLQVPYRSWFHLKTGENLDLNGARPDHPSNLGPGDEDAGRDPQLGEALRILKDLPEPP